MNKLDISKERLMTIIASRENYNFPNFIKELRLSLGISRQEMVCDLHTDYHRFAYMESGSGIEMPCDSIIKKISHYFDIPEEILVEKARAYYVRDRRGKK